MDFKLVQNVKVLFGAGCLERLGELVETLKSARPLVVTDKGIVAAGIADKATAATVDKVGGNMLTQPGKEVVNGKEMMVDQIVVKYCKLDKKETAKLNQAVKK